MSSPPNGLEQIKALYGDPLTFLRGDGTPSSHWSAKMILVPFPEPLPLGWIPVYATNARVNEAIAEEALRLFRSWHNAGIWRDLATYDGGYCWRPMRGKHKLSMHAYGGAFDFNARTNELGTQGNMSHDLIGVAESLGWTWGGRWPRPDPMHFQWGTGY